jgi:cysteine desulfurase/selenocysteine lyase
VIDAVTRAYSLEYANVHRGLHYLSSVATEHYEVVRGTIQRFLGARHEEEIVFTTGSTMGINLVSYSWAAPNLERNFPRFIFNATGRSPLCSGNTVGRISLKK